MTNKTGDIPAHLCCLLKSYHILNWLFKLAGENSLLKDWK
jgi:hypothetical protein